MDIITIITIIFWVSLFLIFWTYFGYLLILGLLSLFFTKKVNRQDYYPEVSLIITAYNEEKRIKQKIENTLALSYPKEKLDIIVVSDGSTDRTEEIISQFQSRGVRLHSIPSRHGKHYGQNEGIKIAKYDILVFTDAATFLENNAIEKISRNFADSKIGCVSGFDKIKGDDNNIQGEGAYVKYEMILRTLESAVDSLIGVSGSFFAIRKHLCNNWPIHLSSDFFTPIITYMNGFRIILEKEAIGYYEVLQQPEKEFIRKVRTIVHGMSVFFKFRRIANPFRYGTYSIQVLTHKLSRWLVPIYLIMFFLSNLLLINQHLIFIAVFIAQVVFYALALFASLNKKLKDTIFFKIPLFFVMVNYSILVAWYYFFRGERFIVWKPTER
ncbi:MAG: glycosyltransferase family 2 protein [candidate division Zixibacteria bacterium]|nr:glycosyltransferase family 2 protein [candidate division Zixibacteria bacterium]